MGIEEIAGDVSGKAITALGGNPVLLGVLLMMAVSLAANIWQQHDTEVQHNELMIKILEFRHNELTEIIRMLEMQKGLTPLHSPGEMNLNLEGR